MQTTSVLDDLFLFIFGVVIELVQGEATTGLPLWLYNSIRILLLCSYSLIVDCGRNEVWVYFGWRLCNIHLLVERREMLRGVHLGI